MDDMPDRPTTGDIELRTLKERLRILEGVIGHRRHANQWTQARQAEALGIDVAGWSRMLSGKTPVRPYVLAQLIDFFDLAPELDYTIFEETSRDALLSRLRSAGAGTFGGSSIHRLSALLFRLSKQSKCRVQLFEVDVNGYRGGIGRPRDPVKRVPIFANGAFARVRCLGPVDRSIALLGVSSEQRITVLSPTDYAPLTISRAPQVIIPDDNSGPFQLSTDSNCYIYAIWCDDGLGRQLDAGRVSGEDDTLGETAAAMVTRLIEHRESTIELAAFNFIVKGERH